MLKKKNNRNDGKEKNTPMFGYSALSVCLIAILLAVFVAVFVF